MITPSSWKLLQRLHVKFGFCDSRSSSEFIVKYQACAEVCVIYICAALHTFMKGKNVQLSSMRIRALGTSASRYPLVSTPHISLMGYISHVAVSWKRLCN